MMLAGTSFMYQPLCAHVSVGGFLYGEIDSDADIGDEFAAYVSRDTLGEVARLAAASVAVLHVDGHRNVAQVDDSIVQFVPVDMVDLALWPASIRHKPSQPVHTDLLFVDGAFPVTGLDGASHFPDFGFALTDFPEEVSSNGVIAEKFMGASKGNLMVFHGNPLVEN